MTKKIFIGMFLLGVISLFSYQVASAGFNGLGDPEFQSFREEKMTRASDSGIEKEEFFAIRDKSREDHRIERMAQREERLKMAVENGCITQEEMKEKMELRKGRFAK